MNVSKWSQVVSRLAQATTLLDGYHRAALQVPQHVQDEFDAALQDVLDYKIGATKTEYIIDAEDLGYLLEEYDA